MNFSPNKRDQQLREIFHKRQALILAKNTKNVSPAKNELTTKQQEIKRLTHAINKKPYTDHVDKHNKQDSSSSFQNLLNKDNSDLSGFQDQVPTYSFRQQKITSNQRDFQSSSGRVDGYEFCVSSASALAKLRSASNTQLPDDHRNAKNTAGFPIQ